MRKHKLKVAKASRIHTVGNPTTGIGRDDLNTARDKCVCGYGRIGAWWWPWCVVMVTVVIRTRYVTLADNWWVLHPDEIFQSIEVAFSEVYGYGFRPFEYLPPPDGNTSNVAEKRVLQSGMYGLRCSLYPRMFMIVLSFAKMTGLDQSPFMVCRIFNAVVTSLLPVAVYWFVLKLFNCRLLALLTCALTAIEHHLTVFGTHTIVNSFISPFLFTGLALSMRSDEFDRRGYGDCRQTKEKLPDHNGNIIAKSTDVGQSINDYLPNHKQPHPNYTTLKCDSLQNSCAKLKNEGCDFRSFLASFRKTLYAMEKSVRINLFLGGFLLGCVCYIRPDTVFFCIFVLSPVIYTQPSLARTGLAELMIVMIGGAAAAMFCMADDWLWFGWSVISPLQWFKFNVLSGKSSRLFGTQDSSLYLRVFMANAETTYLNVCFAGFLLYSKLKRSDVLLRQRQFCAICFSFISSLVVFSLAGHKEVRFIHNVIVLYILIVSYCLHTVTSVISRQLSSNRNFTFGILAIFVAYFSAQSYTRYPSIDEATLSGWTYGDARGSVNVNTCLDWLRRQDDVNGVYIDISLYDTGGFIILKQDVPLLVKMHNELYLYDGRRTGRRHGTLGNIRIIRDYSDYLHKSNTVYLSKLLSRSNTFNYIVSKNYKFHVINSNYSYSRVFTNGRYSIFYRNFSTSAETELEQLSTLIAVGNNATVLEYEASWLISKGLYHIAIERIEGALKLSKSRVRPYQQMCVCYSNLNDMKMLYYYQEECFRRFGKERCVQQQEKVVLHQYYKNFDS